MTPTVRFAPSPTGLLHLGNARLAVVNWLFARAHGGVFILRIDDTDEERSTAAFDAAIREDLAWFGLGWDRLVRQSDRMERYAMALDRLREAGQAYACYETEDELAAMRKALAARHRPPVYDRAGLGLTDDARAKLEAEGRRPHWRFKLAPGSTGWDDLVRGRQSVGLASLSDPVIVRADGRPTYTLASVVDDVELGVTHVIRGEDHVTNTAAQIQIAEGLGATPGRLAFAHLPLLIAADGAKLSKREGDLSLKGLREAGLEPLAIVALLARLGTADPVVPRARIEDAVAGFDLSRFGRAPVRFELAELEAFNHKTLVELPFVAVADRLKGLGHDGVTEAFWLAVRGNCRRLAEVGHWWRVAKGPTAPVIEDASFLAKAAKALPPEPWTETTWAAWTKALAEVTGRQGRALFHPLRLALTGLDHGPEMRYVLPFIGRARAGLRLRGQTA